jgi:anaerobic magnesium-protoporphyrin IX monomethyl ester cyclase
MGVLPTRPRMCGLSTGPLSARATAALVASAHSIRRLPEAGIDTHIVMGGHFRLLAPAATFAEVPSSTASSSTTASLRCSPGGHALDPGRLAGVVHEQGGPPGCAETRHLLRDLDDVPWAKRDSEPDRVLGHRGDAATGQLRLCPDLLVLLDAYVLPHRAGKGRAHPRTRRGCGRERWLHDARGISIFLFQDDDFPLFGRVWKRWTRELIAELYNADLRGRAI